MLNKKPVTVGIIGGLVLLVLYFAILTIAESSDHALREFGRLWFWILPLVTGFGIQIGLYAYIRSEIRAKQVAGATKTIAATGGTSAGSMIACCAHHLTDILPIVGLSGAAIFLAKYQSLFMLVGIFSNLVGITIMLGIIQRYELFDSEKGFLKNILRYNMKTLRNTTVVLSILILSAVFITTVGSTTVGSESQIGASDISKRITDMSTKINDGNGVSVEVTPIELNPENPVKFKVKFTTHQGNLGFEMTEVSLLKDDVGNVYSPLGWEGSPPGGHHRSGVLTFPKLKGGAGRIELVIKNVRDVPERVFTWGSE